LIDFWCLTSLSTIFQLYHGDWIPLIFPAELNIKDTKETASSFLDINKYSSFYPGGSKMVVGSNNSYKPITNAVWVRARFVNYAVWKVYACYGKLK
jgi:hypothetical protein